MLKVKTVCRNLLCPKRINVWKSQPEIAGTNIPAGNLLLCFAILVAGGSATKVLRVFSHMGLACLSLGTFFRHQKVCMLPYRPWQAALRERASQTKIFFFFLGKTFSSHLFFLVQLPN